MLLLRLLPDPWLPAFDVSSNFAKHLPLWSWVVRGPCGRPFPRLPLLPHTITADTRTTHANECPFYFQHPIPSHPKLACRGNCPPWNISDHLNCISHLHPPATWSGAHRSCRPELRVMAPKTPVPSQDSVTTVVNSPHPAAEAPPNRSPSYCSRHGAMIMSPSHDAAKRSITYYQSTTRTTHAFFLSPYHSATNTPLLLGRFFSPPSLPSRKPLLACLLPRWSPAQTFPLIPPVAPCRLQDQR